MNILSTIRETTADGYGLRYSIYVAGCAHKCINCHNKESWNFDQGIPIQDLKDKIYKEISSNPLLDGITVTGGDPLYNSSELYLFLSDFKKHFPKLSVWVYTGYTIQELVQLYREGNRSIKRVIELTDVLVDGRYEEDKKEFGTFRGSSNQQIMKYPIDIFEDIENIYNYTGDIL